MLRIWLFCGILLAAAAVPSGDPATTVGWDDLMGAEWVEKGSGGKPYMEFEAPVEYELSFSDQLKSLAGRQVKLNGFMIPLEMSADQRHFVLSRFPLAHCRYCQPGGPQTMVDVHLDEAIPFSYETVTVTGKLQLMEDDPLNMMFRIVGGKVVP